MHIDDLTTEQRAGVVRRALEWAAPRVRDLRDREVNVDELGQPQRLALALWMMDDGRRLAVQALDAGRSHVESLQSYLHQDEIDVEVTRTMAYAAARLDGSLPRGLDPETLDAADRREIAVRAMQITARELDALSAEDPQLDTELQVMAVAVALATERIRSVAGAVRESRCTWCRRMMPVASDWIQHAVECDASPGAEAMRLLRAISQSLADSPAPSVTAQLLIQLTRGNLQVSRLMTDAVNRRIVASDVGQKSDLSDPTNFGVTCDEPSPLVEVTLSKRQIEGDDCPTCRALRGCSCVVPDPTADDVVEVDGRHFHRERVTNTRHDYDLAHEHDDGLARVGAYDDPLRASTTPVDKAKAAEWYTKRLPVDPAAVVVLGSMRVKAHDGVTPNDVTVANRRLGDDEWTDEVRSWFVDHAVRMGWTVTFDARRVGVPARNVRVRARESTLRFVEGAPRRVELVGPSVRAAHVAGGYAAWCRALETA